MTTNQQSPNQQMQSNITDDMFISNSRACLFQQVKVPHFKFHSAVELPSILACLIIESFLLASSFAMDSIPDWWRLISHQTVQLQVLLHLSHIRGVNLSTTLHLELEADIFLRDVNSKKKGSRPKKSDVEKVESL